MNKPKDIALGLFSLFLWIGLIYLLLHCGMPDPLGQGGYNSN